MKQESKEIKVNTLNYSQALLLLQKGKKVSCLRWGNQGTVYVELTTHKYYVLGIGYKERKELTLFDSERLTMVNFTPSVENQFDDVWFEV